MTTHMPINFSFNSQASDITFEHVGQTPVVNFAVTMNIGIPLAELARAMLNFYSETPGGRNVAALPGRASDPRQRLTTESLAAHTSTTGAAPVQTLAGPSGPPGLDLPIQRTSERAERREKATWNTPLSVIQPTHSEFRSKHCWNSDSLSGLAGSKGPLYLANGPALRELKDALKALSPPLRVPMTHDKLQLTERERIPGDVRDPPATGKAAGGHQAVGSQARPNLGQPPKTAPPPPPAVKSPAGGKVPPVMAAKASPPKCLFPPTKAPPSITGTAAVKEAPPLKPGEVKEKTEAITATTAKAKHEPAPKARAPSMTAKVGPHVPAE